MLIDASFDYVIVGGGSAGCVLANRLSARPDIKVLLIEAGRDTPPDNVPADIRDTYATSYYNKSYMWPGLRAHWRTRDTSPEVGFDQGRVMGGGSSVMGMIALRGTPDDYAEWEQMGAAGWGWNAVLPYFRRLENDLDFDGDLHGGTGPIPIRRTLRENWTPLAHALNAYADERQIPLIADMNGDFRDGQGSLPMSSTAERRASSAMSYLDNVVRRRPNLRIITGSTVTQLIVRGRHAAGVQAEILGQYKNFAAREVILCAGAIHTPTMLMRAGIGNARDLCKSGIEVIADLPGVGRNLQNHPLLFVGAHLRPEARQSPALRPHPMTCLRYSSGIRGCPPSDMYVAAHSKSSWNALGAQIANFNVTIFKPASRGQVSVKSPRLLDQPLVEFNFLSEERDLARLTDGFRRVVDIVTHPRIRALYDAVFPVQFTDRLRRLNQRTAINSVKTATLAKLIDLVPAAGRFAFSRLTSSQVDLTDLIADPAALAEHVRTNVGGTFHVCGTCRMGRADDPQAVVDNAGRVRGVGNLRIVDASIMPTVPRGNTNIPTIMLAEKIAADMAPSRSSRTAA